MESAALSFLRTWDNSVSCAPIPRWLITDQRLTGRDTKKISRAGRYNFWRSFPSLLRITDTERIRLFTATIRCLYGRKRANTYSIRAVCCRKPDRRFTTVCTPFRLRWCYGSVSRDGKFTYRPRKQPVFVAYWTLTRMRNCSDRSPLNSTYDIYFSIVRVHKGVLEYNSKGIAFINRHNCCSTRKKIQSKQVGKRIKHRKKQWSHSSRWITPRRTSTRDHRTFALVLEISVQRRRIHTCPWPSTDHQWNRTSTPLRLHS